MYTLPTLPYDYSELEPYIDAETMHFHHDKHHSTYVDNLNKTLQNYPDLQNKDIQELILQIKKIPEEIRQAVINNGGGHVNHSFYWNIMTPNINNLENGNLYEAINKTFGNIDSFKEKFSETALKHFGSGWGWLVFSNNKLDIISTPNQDSPLMNGYQPIIGIDVWEHAYYLKYQNKRADYINAWLNIINWKEAEKLFNQNKSI